MPRLHIAELYSRHLAVNGDMGNTLVLAERARRAGAEVTVTHYNPGDPVPEGVDLVTMGSGPASAIGAIAGDVATMAPAVRRWCEEGVPMLFVGAAYQLAGEEITGLGAPVRGFGVFQQTTDVSAPRVVTGGFVVDTVFGRLVGIENHGSTTALRGGQSALGRAITGRGNGDADRSEGARTGEALGTHLHGPVLAMNPVVADHMLAVAAGRAGWAYATTDEHDRLDTLAAATRALLEGAQTPDGGERAQ